MHETIRLDAVRRTVALDQDRLSTTAHQRPSAAALDALGHLASAIADRWRLTDSDPWRLLAVMTDGRLLRPAHPV